MLAWEIARQWQLEHSTRSFEELLGWHLSLGLVYSTPSAFMLASEVSWNADQSEIIPTSICRHPPSINAWFIELAVISPTVRNGPIATFLHIAPHPRDWILFRRNNGFRIHAYKWERFAKRLDSIT